MRIKMSIGDVFKGMGLLDLEHEVAVEPTYKIKAVSSTGNLTDVNFLVKKHHEAIRITATGIDFICSVKHLVQTSTGIEFAYYANDMTLSDGRTIPITSKESIGPLDLYDIAIDAPHLYQTADGVVHHNTTVARALCNEIGAEYLFINGSEESGIDVLRGKIKNFASSTSLTGAKKVVILDESDYLSASSTQPALRGAIEEFASNCRFIFTCNFKNRIIEPLHSRCAVIELKIENADKPKIMSAFYKRVVGILKTENVEFEPQVIVELIGKHFPDYRRILNELQRYSVSGKIDAGLLVNLGDESYNSLVKLMKDKNFTEVRKWVAKNTDTESTELFRKFYDKAFDYLEQSAVPQLVLILADYQYKAAFVADREINTMAALTEIMSSCKFSG